MILGLLFGPVTGKYDGAVDGFKLGAIDGALDKVGACDNVGMLSENLPSKSDLMLDLWLV